VRVWANQISEARNRFSQQRANAKSRGIAWRLTFEQWWAIWDASGKWHMRGKLPEQYCMARYNDKGVYKVGNVEIVTNRTNHKNQRRSAALRLRQSQAIKGRRHSEASLKLMSLKKLEWWGKQDAIQRRLQARRGWNHSEAAKELISKKRLEWLEKQRDVNVPR